MSWKGLTRNIARAPQNVKQIFHVGPTTQDLVCQEFNSRLIELEAELKKFNLEAKTYFHSLEQLFERQIGFANVMTETQLLQPHESLDDKDLVNIKTVASINVQPSKTLCVQFVETVNKSRNRLGPEIELLRSKILGPTDAVLIHIAEIHKVGKKRQHKILDVDRYKAALAKLLAKQHQRSASEEKAYFVTQNNLEIAEQEYNWLNTLLKKELPLFFELTEKLIDSLFISMYFVQLNIYYTLNEMLQTLVTSSKAMEDWSIGGDLVTTYHAKTGTVWVRAEKEIGLLKFRLMQSQTKISAATKIKPVAISCAPKETNIDAMMHKSELEFCTAMYNYEPQTVGDLRLIQGETVEIVERTQNWNDWWKGRLVRTGETGIFPANYVQFQ